MTMLIPDYFVYGMMLWLSAVGVLCSRRKIFLDPMYFLLFIPQAVMYLLFDVFSIPVSVRAPYVRLSLALIPACFAVVLSVHYWRAHKWMI